MLEQQHLTYIPILFKCFRKHSYFTLYFVLSGRNNERCVHYVVMEIFLISY